MYKTFMTYLRVKVQSGYAFFFFFFHAESFISFFVVVMVFSQICELTLVDMCWPCHSQDSWLCEFALTVANYAKQMD